MGKTRDTANLISDGNLSVDITNDRIGIGSTTPQYKLDVSGDINFTGTFRQNGTQFVASRWTAGTGDDIYRLSGDVGIGTTNPTSKLQVQGDALITGIATVNSNFVVNGNTIVADATNNRVGIGTTNPTEKLQVVGVVTATSYRGDGSQLTNIEPNITSCLFT